MVNLDSERYVAALAAYAVGMTDFGAIAKDSEHGLSGEDELLNALRSGEPQAVRGFVVQHSRRMHAAAKRILGSEEEAREIVQEAFLHAFQSLQQFRGGSKLGTWLHRIVINEALMRIRTRKSRVVEQSIDELLPRFYDDGHRVGPLPAWTEPADVLLQRGEVRAAVQRCIEGLPESLRVVLVLRDIEGLDVRETGGQLELTDGVVKTRLHRARQALRSLLEKEFMR
jgi:RNA polymerase sigma-70 factor, ECF subfamily